jgi:hypothetical protein
LLVGDGNLAARRILFDDHFRNDGNAQACTDHA